MMTIFMMFRSFRTTFFFLIVYASLALQHYWLYAQTETTTPFQASAPTKFTFTDLLQIRSVNDVEISPSGEQIAYTVSAVDTATDEVSESAWVLRVADKRPVQINLPSARSPSWSPDGLRLAFLTHGKDGAGNVTLLSTDGLQVLKSLPIPSSPGSLVWSPDGKWLAFSLFVPDVANPSFLQQAVDDAEKHFGRQHGISSAPPVQLTHSARYRRDGGTWLKAGHIHLFLLSTVNGNLRQVGTEPFDDSDPSWTPDSHSLVFTSDRRVESSHTARRPAIFKIDIATGALAQLTHASGSFAAPSISPDGRWIAYTGYDNRPVNYTRSDLYLMRLDGTGSRRITDRFDRDVFSVTWASNAQGMYAQYTDHGVSRLGFFGLDGKVKELVSEVSAGYSISRDGEIAYAGDTSTSPNELKFKRTDADPIVLVSLNDFLQTRSLGHLTRFEARSGADGVPVEGWALLPAGTAEHAKLPTILAIHGGPFGSDGPNWSSRFQMYAAAGYAVIYTNYRGSISYGAKFSEPANHDFPGIAYDDLISIVDEAVRQGFTDPNRLFVTGGSAGGELTAWITGKTNRFRAAVAEKPVVNQMSDTLATDQYLESPDTDEGLPWTRERELWAHSPLSLAGSMMTPMLLVVGEEDYRTPIDETLQLYDALQLKGVPTALMRVPGAGHETLGSRPSQLIAEIAATLAWFEQYDLTGRAISVTPAKPPATDGGTTRMR